MCVCVCMCVHVHIYMNSLLHIDMGNFWVNATWKKSVNFIASLQCSTVFLTESARIWVVHPSMFDHLPFLRFYHMSKVNKVKPCYETAIPLLPGGRWIPITPRLPWTTAIELLLRGPVATWPQELFQIDLTPFSESALWLLITTHQLPWPAQVHRRYVYIAP